MLCLNCAAHHQPVRFVIVLVVVVLAVVIVIPFMTKRSVCLT